MSRPTLLSILALAPLLAWAQATPEMEALAPLMGPAWIGEVRGPDGPLTDVSVWSWAVDGRAARNVHAVDGGVYGGETVVWWDGEAYAFVYVTTAGFVTQGTMRWTEEAALEAVERVENSGGTLADGVTRVRTRISVADGELTVRTAFEREGAWGPDDVRTYRRDSSAALPCGLDPRCVEGDARGD